MKYHIITYGCQMNESDSEKIASLLQQQGHKPVKSEADANLIVLNCCSVRQAAIHRVFAKVHEHFKNKKVIVAGCILETDKEKIKDKVAEFWHPDSYFECNPLEIINSPSPPLKLRGGWGALSYVPIMTGCNNFCSYCVVPYTRGRERSRPEVDIISEVKALIKKGHTNIMLLGQNVNSYHEDKSSFLKLLKKINDIPGNFNLSFMTSHPKDMSDELIKTMAQCEKLVKNLHLPIQSGDNTILRKMNRRYTVAHYKSLIKKIRQAIPGIKITTDIIVGFPGETKKQFDNTIKTCRQINFDGAFIAKYSLRPGTAAAKLKDDVPQEEKKRRWRILDTLINKFEH